MIPDLRKMLFTFAGVAGGGFNVAQSPEGTLDRGDIRTDGAVNPGEGAVDEPADQLRTGDAFLFGQQIKARGLILIKVDVGSPHTPQCTSGLWRALGRIGPVRGHDA